MYSKIPIFANKLYTKTSDYQDLYDMYSSILEGREPTSVEESMFKNIKIIYNDYVENGFGSDWESNYFELISVLEDTHELSYLVGYLEDIKKYARGYSIDDSDILQVGEDLEEVFRTILEYMDNNYPWKKLTKNNEGEF